MYDVNVPDLGKRQPLGRLVLCRLMILIFIMVIIVYQVFIKEKTCDSHEIHP